MTDPRGERLRQLENQAEELEREHILKFAKCARYYAEVALTAAERETVHKDMAESLDVIVTMLKDLIDPDWDEELKNLIEGNGT